MSSGNPKKFVFKQPTEHLRRGKACLCCRFHKIKCDGIKPICGPCTRSPKEDPCRYTDSLPRTTALEQNIEQLEARIRDLEGSTSSSASPNSLESDLPSESWHSETRHSSPLIPPFDLHGSPIPSAPSSQYHGEEPTHGFSPVSAHVVMLLVDNFFAHCQELGFFLHISRFRSSAFPFEGPIQLSALLDVICLWGAHLSQTQYEPIFLQRALNQIATEISSVSNHTRILHTIQAEVLLAIYFFRTNRFMEADIHLNGAVSLCLSCGLHKLRSCRPSYSTVLGVFSGREIHFPPPRDPVEEGERINAFWTIFYVHRLMTVSLGTASPSFGILDDPESQVDSPWPLEMEQYEQGHDLTFTSYRTIDNFLATGNQGQSSTVAFHVQSAILLHKAFRLLKKHKYGLTATELDSFISECTSLNFVITQFLGAIPLINIRDNPSISHQAQHRLTVAYALSSCAYMKVQSIFSRCGIVDSQRRACQTADSIVQTIRDLDSLRLCPMMAIVCLASCRTLAEDLEGIQSKSVELFPHFGYQEAESSAQQDDASWRAFVGVALARGVDTMSTMAVDCPLAMYQLERFGRAYNYKLGEYSDYVW